MSNFVKASELIQNKMPSRLYFEKPMEFPELITELNRHGMKEPLVIPRLKIQLLPFIDVNSSKPISQLCCEFYDTRDTSQSVVKSYAKFTDKEAIELIANLIAYLRVQYKIPFSEILSRTLNRVQSKTQESRFFSTESNADMRFENSWNCLESLSFRKVVDHK